MMNNTQDKDIVSFIPEKPLQSKDMTVILGDGAKAMKGELEFWAKIREDKTRLYEFILASNYFDCHKALHTACANVATLIKGQPLEKVKNILRPDNKDTNSAGNVNSTDDDSDVVADSKGKDADIVMKSKLDLRANTTNCVPQPVQVGTPAMSAGSSTSSTATVEANSD